MDCGIRELSIRVGDDPISKRMRQGMDESVLSLAGPMPSSRDIGRLTSSPSCRPTLPPLCSRIAAVCHCCSDRRPEEQRSLSKSWLGRPAARSVTSCLHLGRLLYHDSVGLTSPSKNTAAVRVVAFDRSASSSLFKLLTPYLARYARCRPTPPRRGAWHTARASLPVCHLSRRT